MSLHRIITVALVVLFAGSGCQRRQCSTSLVDRFAEAKFVRETWLIDDPSSVVQIERFGRNDITLRFRGRSAEGGQSVTTILNGSKIGTTAITSDFANYEIPVPVSLLRIGRNALEFQPAVECDWIEIAEHRARPHQRTPRKEEGAIAVPYRSAIRYGLSVEPGSAVVIDAVKAEGRSSVILTVRSERGTTLATLAAAPDGSPMRLGVPVERRTSVELEIAVVPPPGRSRGTYVVLRTPRIEGTCD